MFTEHVGDEIVETLFLSGDRRMERHIQYTSHNIAGEESFDIARGDDAHLAPEKVTILGVARSLASVFESDEEPIVLHFTHPINAAAHLGAVAA